MHLNSNLNSNLYFNQYHYHNHYLYQHGQQAKARRKTLYGHFDVRKIRFGGP